MGGGLQLGAANLFDADISTVMAPYRFEGEGRRADNAGSSSG